jgi:hypothetical protein
MISGPQDWRLLKAARKTIDLRQINRCLDVANYPAPQAFSISA